MIFDEAGIESKLDEPFDSGNNPIYNILVAYAEFDQIVKYTQGMNFLAALLYAATNNEVVAFVILTKVMFELNWREVYNSNLIGLLNLSKKVTGWLKKEQK